MPPFSSLEWRSWQVGLLLVTAATLLVAISYFPGYMSVDSCSQLSQARLGVFNDWHPPLMSWLWGKMDRILPGPLGLLIFHNFLFFSGTWLVCRSIEGGKGRAVGSFLFLGLYPPVFALLGTAWKDVAFGVSLSLAFGLFLHCSQARPGNIFWWASWAGAVVATTYGLAVRHNAPPATLPFFLWAGWIAATFFYPQLRTKKTIAAIGIGSTLFLLSLALNIGLTKFLTHGKSLFPSQQIMVYDLVGISVRIGRVILPEYLKVSPGKPAVTISDLQKIYTPDELVPLFCCDEKIRRLHLTEKEENFLQLRQEWFKAIRVEPVSYLRHRAKVFMSEFGIKRTTVCSPFHIGVVPNDLGVKFYANALNRAETKLLNWIKNSIIFRGWFYLVLSALFFGIAVWKFRSALIPEMVLAASVWLYSLPYYFVATTCDFRMVWWSMIGTLLMPFVMRLGHRSALPFDRF